MAKRIAILQGHPSRSREHLGMALAEAYAGAAAAAGHDVKTIEVAALDFSLLREPHEWHTPEVPAGLRDLQDTLVWSDHIVVLYPLWHGSAPALFKGALEQVIRPAFASQPGPGGKSTPRLRGKSARTIVTMGMPAFVFRWVYGGLGVRALNRDTLGFCGVAPIRTLYIGGVHAKTFRADRWIACMHELGMRAR